MGRMTATVHDSAQAPVYARLQEGSEAPDFTLPAIVPGTAENGLINLFDTCSRTDVGLYCTSIRRQ